MSLEGPPLPHPPEDDPADEVLRIERAARSSFAFAMRLMSRQRRGAMLALYAFARLVDDVADGPWAAASKHAALDAWAEEVDAAYHGRAISAVGQAVGHAAGAYALPREEFHGLIDGMRMDVDGPVIAPDDETFRLYCRRVAGTVGLISMRIFGAWRGDVSERFALALADALQITNILRDVSEDARLGRLYLPQALLGRHDVPPRPEAVLDAPGLRAVCGDMADVADGQFATARTLIPAHDRRALVPALAMMGAYETMLKQLRASSFRPGTRVSRGLRLTGSLLRIARG